MIMPSAKLNEIVRKGELAIIELDVKHPEDVVA